MFDPRKLAKLEARSGGEALTYALNSRERSQVHADLLQLMDIYPRIRNSALYKSIDGPEAKFIDRANADFERFRELLNGYAFKHSISPVITGGDWILGWAK